MLRLSISVLEAFCSVVRVNVRGSGYEGCVIVLGIKYHSSIITKWKDCPLNKIGGK